MPKVTLENLTKVFAGPGKETVRAVSDLSLDIAAGERLALVGPSGCGKSTTLRLIAGLESATSGSIRIGGRDVTRLAPAEREVAMVFQSLALFPHLTAHENLAFGLRVRKLGGAEIKARVAEAATLLELADCLGRKPAELSGGQRQRVALGRAMVRRAGVLLLDEPLSNLDAPLRAQMRRDLATLHARLDCTMIYVTHDQAEAMSLGSRVAVMSGGRLQQADEPLKVYHQPMNRFVAGFIGVPAMNFFKGEARRTGSRLVFAEKNDGSAEPGGAEGFVFDLDESLAATLAGHLGKPLIMGIRPEHLAPVAEEGGTGKSASISARIEKMEHLGAETLLHARTAFHNLTSRVLGAPTNLKESETAAFHSEPADVKFFNPETGAALRQ